MHSSAARKASTLVFWSGLLAFQISALAQGAGPSITITPPANASLHAGTSLVQTTAGTAQLQGTAAGASGIVGVSWIDHLGRRGKADLAAGPGGAVNWTATVPLRPGGNQFTLIAVDRNNKSATAHILIHNTGIAPLPPKNPVVHSAMWRGRSVTYEVIDGLAVSEGDMILGIAADLENPQVTPAATGKASAKKNGFALDYISELWPRVGGVAQIPYIVTAGAAAAPAVAAFNASLAGFVQYVPRNAEANYVNFNLTTSNGGSCASNVGMIGGAQTITGDPTCNVPVLLHEMGHSVGLYHEQQRPDYATYVTLTLANVDKPFIQGNYDLPTSDDQAIGLYDYAAVMHYNPFGFSKNGLATIESIPAGIPLSNDVGYSAGDLDTIRRLYGFTPTAVTITTNPPGLKITVDGAVLTAPQTFNWALNGTHTLDLPADPQFTNPNDGATYKYGRWNDNVARSHTITVSPGSGSLSSPAAQPAVTMYEANFIRLHPFGSSVFPAASGTVTPTPAPQSIFSGSFYVDRQQVSLQATPAAAFNFAGWFVPGFSQSDNPKTLIVQSPVPNAQAYFVNGPVTIIGASTTGVVPTAPPFYGTIDANFIYLPQGFANDLNFGGAAWAGGTTHSIAVTSPESPSTTNIRYNFTGWSDNGAITHNITASSSGLKTVAASFIPAYRTYALFNPNCGGTVNFSPVSPTGDGFYNEGTLLSSSAVPTAGLVFSGWTGDLTGLTNPQSVTLHDQFVPQANFNTVAGPLTITGFSPAVGMDMTVVGTGFTAGTQTSWNFSFRNSTFVSATQLTMHLNAGDLSTPGGQRVTLQNPSSNCSPSFEGTFDVKSFVATPPTADSVAGISPGNLNQTLTFKYSSVNGFGYLSFAYALLNASLTGTGGCWPYYDQTSNAFFLAGDGTAVRQGPLAPGTGGGLSNAQCTLNGTGSSVSGAGNTLTAAFNLTFSAGFGASHNIYMSVLDAGNMNSGWQTKGTTAGANSPPTADSVAGVAPGSLTQPSLAFKYSSANGATYLTDTYALFNGSLNGVNGCWVFYDRTANGFYLVNDAQTGLLGPLAQNAAGTLSNTQCTLNGSGSNISQAGNTLTMNLNVTFAVGFGAAQSVFMYAADAGGQNSGWQAMGTTGTASVPTSDSVAGITAGALAQTLTFKYSSANGNKYLNDVHALFSATLTGANACWIFYDKGADGWYLINDAASSYLGPLPRGSTSSLNNSQCTLNGTGSSVTGAGNTLTMVLKVTFSAAFGAAQNIFLYASDEAGQNSGWMNKGTTASSALPTSDSVTGMTNGTAAQSLVLKYSSGNGAKYLGQALALVNTGLSGPGACWVFYNKPADSFYLANDAGSAYLGPLARGSSGTLTNSQCTLNGTGSTVSTSGNTLTMTLSLTIAGLHGAQGIFMYASDAGGMTSGWVSRGAVTLP